MALLAAVGIFGCKSDPSGVTPDDTPVKIVANPAILTVSQGASKTITIEVVDSNGHAVPAEISAVAGSADITVTPDTSAELVYGPDGVAHANTSTREARFTVVGTGLNSTTITVTSGDLTTTLPVVVVPVDLAATLSSATPALGAPVTITAPAGLTFAPDATVTLSSSDNTSAGVVTANDGTTLTFVPFIGTDAKVAVRGVIPAYAPTLLLNLNLSTQLTVGDASTLTKVAGTDDITTAPTIPTLAAGQSVLIYDKPPFGWAGCTGDLGDNCNLYKVVITAPTTLHVALDWDNTSDLGVYVLDATGTSVVDVGSADAAGTGSSAHPEEGDLTFDAPGTYYIGVLRFTYAGSTADPSYYSLQVTGQ